MSRVIISLCGRKRTGKESAYKLILPYIDQPEEFQFATPLKKFCIEVLGLSYEQCYGNSQARESLTPYLWGGIDPEIRERWGKTVDQYLTAREVLQVVGTDLMRRQFYQDIWAEGSIREAVRSAAKAAIYTDTRFISEIEIIRQAYKLDPSFTQTILIRLYRQTGLLDTHESETSLDGWDIYPNQREIRKADFEILEKNGYERIEDTLWRAKQTKPFPPYDYLIDNNYSLDILRNNMICILKDRNIYTEPTCS